MANNYDRGMDDAYLGKAPARDATIEYLQGYARAEGLLYPEPLFPDQQQEQVDNRVQEHPCADCVSFRSGELCGTCDVNWSERIERS